MIAALDALPADNRPCICDIGLWEVATLVERGRLAFTVSLDEWLESAAHPRSARLLTITPAIVTCCILAGVWHVRNLEQLS